jgi:hypothetical protein
MQANPPAPPSPDIGYGKAVATLIAGALATLTVIIANQYLAKPIPSEAVAPGTTVLMFLLVILIPHDAWTRVVQVLATVLIAGVLLMPSGAIAQGKLQPVKPSTSVKPSAPVVAPSSKNVADILRKGIADNITIGTQVIADANFANIIATAAGLTLDTTCTAAISAFATKQVALLQSLPTDIPDPAFITYFVIGRVLGKTVKNGLPIELHVGCDPVVIDTGKDINSAMVKIVGAGGLAFLTGGIVPPGLPIP